MQVNHTFPGQGYRKLRVVSGSTYINNEAVLDTIDTSHLKVITSIQLTKSHADRLMETLLRLETLFKSADEPTCAPTPTGNDAQPPNMQQPNAQPPNMQHFNMQQPTTTQQYKTLQKIREMKNSTLNLINQTNAVYTEYRVSIIGHIANYYQCKSKEVKITKSYHRTLSTNDFVGQIEYSIQCLEKMNCEVINIKNQYPTIVNIEEQTRCDDPHKLPLLMNSRPAVNNFMPEKKCENICRCGQGMNLCPEQSEFRCSHCGEVKTISGTFFRDEQVYLCERGLPGYSEYRYSKHLRFWLEHLQAKENKKFNLDDLAKIDAVIKEDRITCSRLTCKEMRSILKDPRVGASTLNENAPLLVKMFGGHPPPIFDFAEERLIQLKFDRIMRLFEQVIVNASANKPYYPYFIYKIIELFIKDPEKRRMLNYIHLQSSKTITKDDGYFKLICEASLSEDNLVYIPTDPSSHI